MKKLNVTLLLTIFILIGIDLSAQKYAVYFTDKNNSPYSINAPEEFLSQRSIDRRTRHEVETTVQDLPVNPQYVQSLRNLGATVPFTSRWLNCALVSCSQSVITQIQQLSFVSEVVYVSPESYGGKSIALDKPSVSADKFILDENLQQGDPKDIKSEAEYGLGFEHINQINGIPVHELGFRGEGVLIAILDAGFENVNSMEVFENVFEEERIVFTKDIVKPGGNVYDLNTSSHGTMVLSCMATNINEVYIGTAPKASYALIRTEDSQPEPLKTEYLVECYNWVIGAETADSIGSDIINSSLSYSTFDDPSMDYTFSQMDGETGVASIAAKIAVEKGIFITNSAGNSFGTSWPWVGTPADAADIATIGAVDVHGLIASFSSTGPNAAGDPKPNVSARGLWAFVYSSSSTGIMDFTTASGTSFSSPIACGMYACLIQANPLISPLNLRNAVDQTGDRYPDHDDRYGYGIPDFAEALENIGVVISESAPQYAVYFKDKNNSPYSINEPLEYLSQRAIDRRERYNIDITEEDFPVNQNYVEEVESTGAVVRSSSRWGNFVLVYADDEIIQLVNNLECVEKTVFVKPSEDDLKKYDIHPKWENLEIKNVTEILDDNYNYGSAYDQINQLNGIYVHEQGFTGEDVVIAVLDSGFEKVDVAAGFSHLFDEDRILLATDVVEPGRNVYESGIHFHGTVVLSCMGGLIEGSYVGTAPKASYALIRTEDAETEYLIEEYFWMIGAEIADSLGADIINSSLGYNTFDDPSMDHTYSEMDGKTAISSIAAKMAVERGIFVNISAGNSNYTDWPWVGTPADVPEVLSIAAVDGNGQIAYFSSIGPNGAGDLKPNVAACGVNAAVIGPSGSIATSNGTSFSSPINCGLVACVIGSDPSKTPGEIHLAIEKSANRYPNHDVNYGYGIADYRKVLAELGYVSIEEVNKSNLIAYPNPVSEQLSLKSDKEIKYIEVVDILGRLVKIANVYSNEANISVNEIASGVYFVKIVYDTYETETLKIIKE
ncbi:S8 family peptidase [Bacteroidales bacterium OttesenSCG-928-K22]|nr:S8 family peptidase [Bacteroidales bacterium OttesenSCG-928-L14]MDL2240324.1 S8 family peptidase [Bacteroidales bacterium OttesenSCG-928-K22]